MNRSKRRVLEKKYGKDFAMQKYREEAIEAGAKQGVRSAVDVILYMVAYTLNYKLGFGRKRLQRIMYHIVDNVDAYNTGHLTPEDFKTIKQEMKKLGFCMKGD